MLRDWGNNGNIFLGIGGVKKSQTSSTPSGFSLSNNSLAYSYYGEGQIQKSNNQTTDNGDNQESSQELEGGLGDVLLDPVDEHVSLKILFLFPCSYLEEDENTMRSQMLRWEDSLESDEGDLHGKEGTSNIENAVGNIETSGHLSNNEQENLEYV